MGKQTANNVRLGIFVVCGVALLVFALYTIGQNRSFWSAAFTVRSRFRNVNGLMEGNNVRYSGIQCGTVRSIAIIDDTTIEVTMQINPQPSRYIRSNSYADIGTEGLMGNKVVNILPNSMPAPAVENGAMLQPFPGKSLNDMLGTLSHTNENAADLSVKLNEIADKLNNSPVLQDLLTDTTLSGSLRMSIGNIRNTSVSVAHAAKSLDLIVSDLAQGKGAAGILLRDERSADDIAAAIRHMGQAAAKAETLVSDLGKLVAGIDRDLNNGQGVAYTLLKDPEMARQLNTSVGNIEKGTAAFSEDMEALKHNFLLRGYFRRQERKNKDTHERSR